MPPLNRSSLNVTDCQRRAVHAVVRKAEMAQDGGSDIDRRARCVDPLSTAEAAATITRFLPGLPVRSLPGQEDPNVAIAEIADPVL